MRQSAQQYANAELLNDHTQIDVSMKLFLVYYGCLIALLSMFIFIVNEGDMIHNNSLEFTEVLL
jgi:hypothetical protein